MGRFEIIMEIIDKIRVGKKNGQKVLSWNDTEWSQLERFMIANGFEFKGSEQNIFMGVLHEHI